jgi:flagellar basal-body rod modification protein FlgD
MAVSGVGSGTTVQTQTNSDQLSLNQDFDQFLRLLTTQLQNQDPLSPMDSAEFTNQLVQFSGVEQQIKTNTQLENLLAMQTLNLTALGLSFIGKDIEMPGQKFQTDGEGGADLTYMMPAGAKTGTLTILDKDSNVVYSTTPSFDEGSHTLKWDGKNKDGNLMPAGTYEVRVAALGENNAALNVQTYVPGYVQSLESADDGSLYLIVNGEQVSLTDVRKVSQPSS